MKDDGLLYEYAAQVAARTASGERLRSDVMTLASSSKAAREHLQACNPSGFVVSEPIKTGRRGRR